MEKFRDLVSMKFKTEFSSYEEQYRFYARLLSRPSRCEIYLKSVIRFKITI